MSKKTAKKPARKSTAPKSQRQAPRPKDELSDEELSQASGGTLLWSSPWSINLSSGNPTQNPDAQWTVSPALWLLKK